jgi:hypothetical protein
MVRGLRSAKDSACHGIANGPSVRVPAPARGPGAGSQRSRASLSVQAVSYRTATRGRVSPMMLGPWHGGGLATWRPVPSLFARGPTELAAV